MSNTETRSPLVDCVAPHDHDPEHVQLVQPKDVHLGGEEALKVRRTLPSLRRSFVGAWCFVDHYGPERGVCMDVPPHPHTGLQTLSWLFDGEIEHRDSGGVQVDFDGVRGAIPRLDAPPLPPELRLKRRFRRGRQ